MSAQSEITRFVGFYESEVLRTGFRPDHTSTRDTRIAFLQQTVKRFCSPLLAMKRADPGRPISDEVVVFVEAGPEYRVFADFLIGGGSAAWQLSTHLEGYLPTSQPLVNPLTLAQLPENTLAPTVPGCLQPGPGPTPTPGCQFPPRDQGLLFFTALDGKYEAKGYPVTPYFVDKEGTSVWYAQYLLYRTQGLDHAAAQAKVFAEIDAIWYP